MVAIADASSLSPFPSHDLSAYPSSHVLWLTGAVDGVCDILQCQDWRSWSGLSEATRVVYLRQWWVYKQLTYTEFVQQTASPFFSWRTWYAFAFETSSTSLGNLGTPAALLVLALLVWLLRGIKAVLLPRFCKLGRWAGQRTHGEDWIVANEERIEKFGEYAFRLCYHSGISLYGLWLLAGTDWWYYPQGTANLFRGWPAQPVDPPMAWYYLLQAAYNVDAMLSLLVLSFHLSFHSPVNLKTGRPQLPVLLRWSDKVRGDFREMMVHHIATNLLVIGSSIFCLFRIGSMIFLLHDISDVPVDLSKLFNFLKWKWTTFGSFMLMLVTWSITRMMALPLIFCRSVATQSQFVLDAGPYRPPTTYFIYYQGFFFWLLTLLFLLHAFWFTLFLRMLSTFVQRSECHDYSEHKTGEQDQKLAEAPPSVEKKAQ